MQHRCVNALDSIGGRCWRRGRCSRRRRCVASCGCGGRARLYALGDRSRRRRVPAHGGRSQQARRHLLDAWGSRNRPLSVGAPVRRLSPPRRPAGHASLRAGLRRRFVSRRARLHDDAVRSSVRPLRLLVAPRQRVLSVRRALNLSSHDHFSTRRSPRRSIAGADRSARTEREAARRSRPPGRNPRLTDRDDLRIADLWMRTRADRRAANDTRPFVPT